MTEAPSPPSHRSLLLHPWTHAVYSLSDDTVFHDYSTCIDIDLSDFEKLTQTGPCSAERLVEYSKLRNGGFHFSQLVFLKLRGDTGGYAWASRLRVHVNFEVPELGDYDVFGQEFLWIWPTSAAINAFVCYQERNSLSMVHNAQLEHFAPATGHNASLPGAQIGPDDFDEVKRVSLVELTPAQRFFIFCIRPQRTQFQRRRLTDRWPTAMQEVDDKNERSLAQQWLKRKRGTARHTVDHLHRLNQASYTGFGLEQMPNEIVVRLLGTTLAISMTERANVTWQTICSLRRVSKQMRILTDGFVGIALAQLMQKVTGMVRTGSAKTTTILQIGAELRTLGITPLLMLELRSSGVVSLSEEIVSAYPVLRPNPAVPRWQKYIALRKRLDMSVSSEQRHVSIKQKPSSTYKRVCFVNNIETSVNVPEYDQFISDGSVSRNVCAMAMIENVGV